jgi:hypothetical protein
MTLRDFSSKYNLPLGQVKAAIGVHKGEAAGVDYMEEELIFKTTAYYMVDMRFCIERAAKDNEMLKKLAEKMPSA